jgi:hypothetical protein
MTQLSAIGRADVDTTIAPNITFFKSVYKKHTNFAMEPKRADFQGSTGYDRRNTNKLPRQGDLIAKMYWYVKLAKLDNGDGRARFAEDVGRLLCNEATIEIGSVIIDRLYPEQMHMWEELTTDRERQLGKLTGKSQSVAQLAEWAKYTQHMYIPMPFWFHCDYGSALPTISTHLTDIQVNIKTPPKSQCIVGMTPDYVTSAADGEFLETYLLLETVYLDDAERRFLVETELKYIINQTQYLGLTTISMGSKQAKIDVRFNQPCKYVMFAGRADSNTAKNSWFDFTGPEQGEFAGELFSRAVIKLNGNNRFDPQLPFYLRQIQACQHNTRIPEKHIYAYNFALFPEMEQASGSINFSRIDNTRLELEFSNPLPEGYSIFIFTRSINVITISNGVAQLRFS